LNWLTTQDATRAGEIAERLDRLNRERQQMEERILKEIIARVAERPELAERYCLVFAGPGWHRGVIGIVAQRVARAVSSTHAGDRVEDGQAQGSGRSIAPFNLLDGLTAVGDLFDRFGGHGPGRRLCTSGGTSQRTGKSASKFTRAQSFLRRTLKPPSGWTAN